MKPIFFYLLTATVLTAILINGCNTPNSQNPPGNDTTTTKPVCNPGYAFLVCPKDVFKIPWIPKQYDTFRRFIFCPFDSTVSNPWQLMCFGQGKPHHEILYYRPLSKPYQIFKGKLDTGIPVSTDPIISDSLTVGNLDISRNKMEHMVFPTQPNGANLLVFMPYFRYDTIKHLNPIYVYKRLVYRIFQGNYQNNKIVTLPFDPRDFQAGDVNTDGSVNLNPCPPAHKNLDDN